MKKSVLFLFLVIIAVYSGTVYAEFNYQSYQPSTIHDIINEHNKVFFNKDNPEKYDFQITAKHFKYRVRCKYLGQKKSVRENAKQLIQYWGKSLSIDQGILNLYKQEILIKSQDSEYWIPIQDQLIQYLDEEVKPGDLFDLYIMFIGTWGQDWIFIANEFQK